MRTIAGMTPSSLIAIATLDTSIAAATSPMSMGASRRASTTPAVKTPARLIAWPSRLHANPRDTRVPRLASPRCSASVSGGGELIAMAQPSFHALGREHVVVDSLCGTGHQAGVEPRLDSPPRGCGHALAARIVVEQLGDGDTERSRVTERHEDAVDAR